MKAISLFSGIGGLDLAAESAGIDPVLFCEIEPYPCEILRKRWPDVDNAGNVKAFANKLLRELGGSPYERFRVPSDYAGTVDVVYGGFPCQDLSCAGKQAGLSGERSGLWYEMLRVVREIRPRWVVAENVRGAINLALDVVQSGLEDEGYVVWPFVIPAAAFGAPHRRERLFVVAARADVADAVAERLEGRERAGAFQEPGAPAHESVAECGARLWPTPSVRGNHNRRGLSERSGDGLATVVKLWPTQHRNCSNGAGEHGDGGRNIQTAVNGTLNPDWVECLQGFPLGWTDIDCDEPEPWPGWPAMMGERVENLWPTPRARDWKAEGYESGLNRDSPMLQTIVKRECASDQYPYEPPRTCGKIPNRAKRLKCLGNAVVPQQAAAFFEAIREMNA